MAWFDQLGGLAAAIRARPFAHSISALVGGTALRQMLIFAVAPLLTRLYAPADFGVLTVFTSALSIGTAISTLAYHMAIPLPDADDTAANILALCCGLTLFTGIVVGIAALFWGGSVAAWLTLPAASKVGWLLAPGILGAGTYQALSYWSSRVGRFGLLAKTKLAQGVGQDAIQLAAGLAGSGPIGLVLGYAAGQVIGTSSLTRGARIPWRAVNLRRVRAAARAYVTFPLYTLWSGLINILGLQVPPVLIAHAFGGGVAGEFGLTVRVLALPAVLLGQACAQVFYPAAAQRAENEAELARLTERVAAALLSAGLVAFIPCLVAGPDLFSLVFGPQWADAGRYAQIMAPWAIVSLVSSPISGLYLVKRRQGTAVLLTIYESGFRIGAILLGARLGSSRIAVGLFSAAGCCISVVSIGWSFHLSGVSCWRWLKDRLTLCACAVGVGTLWVLGRHYIPPLAMAVVITTLLSLVAWRAELRPIVREIVPPNAASS